MKLPWVKWASILLLALNACSGGCGGGSVATPSAALAPLTLSLPQSGLSAAQLGVIVATGDPLSESVAAYYQSQRGVPAANIIHVNVSTASDAISDSDFAALKAQVDAQLPSGVQATLLTWSAPSRVSGNSCSMGITSAMAFGYDPQYCATSCVPTTASPYFDAESHAPFTDFGVRPSMMLGASSVAAAQALINLGASADGTLPSGTGYLIRTTDVARSVRYPDYIGLPALWAGNSGLALNYIDNSNGTSGGDSISNQTGVLFYFTGLVSVPNLGTNTYLPGAIADSLTSYGGLLPSGNGQMPITAWLNAGLTGSYGTVEEPCAFPEKFSKASVLIDHYYRGDTLIEAYWKAVKWPGQGLFIGEPLARPFADSPSFSVVGSHYQISTRGLRANANYSLQYLSNGNWTTLASYNITRAQPETLTAPLAPPSATQLRWQGPCPNDITQQCTLASSN